MKCGSHIWIYLGLKIFGKKKKWNFLVHFNSFLHYPGVFFLGFQDTQSSQFIGKSVCLSFSLWFLLLFSRILCTSLHNYPFSISFSFSFSSDGILMTSSIRSWWYFVSFAVNGLNHSGIVWEQRKRFPIINFTQIYSFFSFISKCYPFSLFVI